MRESRHVVILEGKEFNWPPGACGGTPRDVSATHVINTSNAKPSRKGAKTSFHGNGVHSQCAEYYAGTK